MTPTEQAARWLADVPRRDPNWNREVMNIFKDGDWIGYDDAIAAIARHLAPGDDLKLIADCELAAKVMTDAGTFETGQSILREAAARISALTATVGDAREQRSDAEARMETAETETATLRDRLARVEVALVAIDAMDPEQQINGFSESALRGTVLHMGAIARAALTDGGSNG